MVAFLTVFRSSLAFRARTRVDLVATNVTSGGMLLSDTAVVVGGAVGGHAVA